MDDLLSFVVDFDCDFKHADCDKHPDGSCTEIHTIFHDLFHFYHERLTMEIEPHTGTFKFLESMITVKDNVISSQFYLRNYNRNQNRVTKNFLNTQHWDSYNNAPIKRALVLGTLYRILRFSDPLASTVLPVIAHWTVELRDHGYPAHVLHIDLLGPCQVQLSHAPSGVQSVAWLQLSTMTPRLTSLVFL